MLYKILISIFAFFVLVFGGAYLFIQLKGDVILQKFSSVIEEKTGSSLKMEELPSLSVFPRLSIHVSKAQWGNENIDIAFDSANASISLRKLISGNFRLNNIEIINPVINLNEIKNTEAKKTQEGKNKEKEATSSLEKDIANIFNLIPDDINIKNASLNYKDANQELKLSHLNLTAEDFDANSTGTAQISSDIAFKNVSQDFTVSIKTELKALLAKHKLNLSLKEFQITPRRGLPFDNTINIEASTKLPLSTLLPQDLTASLSSPVATLQIKGGDRLSKDSIQLNFDGTFSLEKIVAIIAPNLTLPPSASQEGKVTATLDYTNGILAVKKTVTQAQNQVYFDFKYNTKQPELTGSMTSTGLVLESLLPLSEKSTKEKSQSTAESSASSSVTPSKTSSSAPIYLPEPLNTMAVDFNIALNNIQYNKIKIDTIKAHIKGLNSLFDIKPFDVSVAGQTVNMASQLNFTKAQSFALKLEGKDINIETLSNKFLESDALEGNFSIQTSLTGSLTNPLATLGGKGNIVAKPLAVTYSLFPLIEKLLNQNGVTQSREYFSTVHIPFSISNGLIDIPDAQFESKLFSLSAIGTVNLVDQALNIASRINLVGVALPVSIKGTMSDPKIGLEFLNPVNIITSIPGAAESIVKTLNPVDRAEDIAKGLGKLFGK